MSSTAAARRPGRPARISSEDVVATAVEIADAEGLEKLHLKRVADRLGVTPAALYRLVDGPLDLVAMVIRDTLDRMTAGACIPADDWRKAVAAGARLLHSVLREHPLLVEAYAHRPVTSANAQTVADRTLTAMLDAGLDESAAVDAYATVQAYVVGYATLEHRRDRIQPGTPSDPATVVTTLERLRPHFAGRYYTPEGFEVGLALLLDGIAGRLAAASRATRARQGLAGHRATPP